MNHRHYSKAPIVEAVIDIGVVLIDGIGLDDVASLSESLKDKFPDRTELFTDTIEFRPNGAGSKREHIGFRLSNNETRQVLLLRMDGFGFSKLAPYETWEMFQRDAHFYWKAFMAICHPVKITRVALRYINRLDIPIQEALGDFLYLYPVIPAGFQHHMANRFFVQLQLPQPDIDSLLVLNQVAVEPPNIDMQSIIVDFDLFKEVDLPIDNEQEAWDHLDVLRERKNVLFEACITDKTREIIQ